jgi:hypothetical protein
MKINDITNEKSSKGTDADKDTLDYKVRTNKITGGGGSLDQIQQKFAKIPIDMGPRKKEKEKEKKKDDKPKAVTKPVTKPEVTKPVFQPQDQQQKPKNDFPVSKTGVQLKPGDVVNYTNQKGQQKKATVNAMLRTTDKQGDLQIQLKLGGATYAIDRANITAANGEPWEFDPGTERGRVKESILKEGGNVFKTEPKDPASVITQRIATADVDPTIDWLNKTFGFKFVDADKLGTTGKKVKPDGTFEENSSGDIDLNVDVRELPKEEIIAKLTAWCQKQGISDLEVMNKGRTFTGGWVANAGLQVHFRTPIKGDVKNGFVQTDFMLTDNPDLQRGAKRGGTENYTGADRAVLLSSLARGRGYKFSPTKGVVDPNNGDEVVANNWDEIAEILLGKGATEADTHTVESMLEKLKSDPNYEELIAPWKENMEKQGKTVPESLADKQFRRLKELLPR